MIMAITVNFLDTCVLISFAQIQIITGLKKCNGDVIWR